MPGARKTIPLAGPRETLTPGHANWPQRLGDLRDAPLWLRAAGRLPMPEPAVAVVGTRYADDEATEFARRLARDVAAAGGSVISGGARGIDAAAHEGALEANGYTLAVLATGILQAYPRAHAPLFARIAASGLLLSEAPDGQGARPGLFVKRNRLIAALADVVVVVQAPRRSGALSTAGWAKRLNRRLLAVPSAPWDIRGEGCLELIRQGSGICTSARDVLSVRLLGASAVPETAPDLAENGSDPEAIDDDERRVLKVLRRRPVHPDEVACTAGMPVWRVQEVLLTLMLNGIVEERTDGRYAKTAN